ncbi:hypothetical protein HN018_26470 (plasmid) [Lichenicola cladoniae]|uniref:Uncharacterized protein n=1 Tax=Lichenicola cladoniae TaxID=1484109 RepID=A0A6M8HZW3_9PROT|nr:hypothetical protein [Lichenicola cladoniae]NPD69331.1 hypothetical protein [Acetobacteraceae bacterium]QKE93685.1 hypothetical protein HN018_26470 [Lichenicola cladoniae]
MTFDATTRAFWSGFWNLKEDEAEPLVGGWLYLHLTKTDLSYYGGPVLEFEWVEISGVVRTKRIRFRFQPSAAAKGVRWRGQSHARAWTGGPVDAAYPHERTTTPLVGS